MIPNMAEVQGGPVVTAALMFRLTGGGTFLALRLIWIDQAVFVAFRTIFEEPDQLAEMVLDRHTSDASRRRRTDAGK